jgi:hypothetical protein
VPGVVLGWTVHVAERVLVGAHLAGGVAGSISGHIAEQHTGILD